MLETCVCVNHIALWVKQSSTLLHHLQIDTYWSLSSKLGAGSCWFMSVCEGERGFVYTAGANSASSDRSCHNACNMQHRSFLLSRYGFFGARLDRRFSHHTNSDFSTV